MYTGIKYIVTVLFFSNFIFIKTNNYLCLVIVFEILWVCGFSLCNMLGIFVGDCTGYCLSFVVLVLAACEIITLLTLYLLDENN